MGGWTKRPASVGRSPVGSLLFSSGFLRAHDFVCVLQDWSLRFPQSCGNPIIKSCWLQGQILWGFPVPLSDPQAGKPDVGFKMVTTVQELLWYYYSLICGCPPGGYRIWFYCDCTPPNVSLRLLLCLGMWSTFFLVGSSVLLLMAVQQLVAVLVLL